MTSVIVDYTFKNVFLTFYIRQCYETCIHSRFLFLFCQFVATNVFFALSCMSIRDCHKTVLNIEQFVYCLTPLIDSKRLSGHFSRPIYRHSTTLVVQFSQIALSVQ